MVIYDVSSASDGEHVGNRVIRFALTFVFAVLWYILSTVDWQFGHRNEIVLHQNSDMVPHLDDTTAVEP